MKHHKVLEIKASIEFMEPLSHIAYSINAHAVLGLPKNIFSFTKSKNTYAEGAVAFTRKFSLMKNSEILMKP